MKSYIRVNSRIIVIMEREFRAIFKRANNIRDNSLMAAKKEKGYFNHQVFCMKVNGKKIGITEKES